MNQFFINFDLKVNFFYVDDDNVSKFYFIICILIFKSLIKIILFHKWVKIFRKFFIFLKNI